MAQDRRTPVDLLGSMAQKDPLETGLDGTVNHQG